MDLDRLQHELASLAFAGLDSSAEALATFAEAEGPLATERKQIVGVDPDETPWLFLDAVVAALSSRVDELTVGIEGELKEIEAGPRWSTPMLTPAVYAMVPESRPFAKRVKPEEQVIVLESCANDETITDLRLLQIYLKPLTEKNPNAAGKAMLELALPAFGKDVLPDLWPSLTPQSRSFEIAYKIDIQATLAKLQERAGPKKADRGGPVIEAVTKLLEQSKNDYGEISPESLPILKLGLKMAPESTFRRKVAEMISNMGDVAQSALPELIDAFERGGLTRDYNLIQPMVRLGKNSPDVAASLVRALDDRDASVRLFSAFNLGQLASLPTGALGSLEFLAANDQDQKVRDQATRTLNKIKARLEPALAE
jgi:hypothetical protein